MSKRAWWRVACARNSRSWRVKRTPARCQGALEGLASSSHRKSPAISPQHARSDCSSRHHAAPDQSISQSVRQSVADFKRRRPVNRQKRRRSSRSSRPISPTRDAAARLHIAHPPGPSVGQRAARRQRLSSAAAAPTTPPSPSPSSRSRSRSREHTAQHNILPRPPPPCAACVPGPGQGATQHQSTQATSKKSKTTNEDNKQKKPSHGEGALSFSQQQWEQPPPLSFCPCVCCFCFCFCPGRHARASRDPALGLRPPTQGPFRAHTATASGLNAPLAPWQTPRLPATSRRV